MPENDERVVLATIRLSNGALNLYSDWKWRGDLPDMRFKAAEANFLSVGYSYSPAHGRPGPWLAKLVADEIGGKLELPEAPETPEGAVF